jgi:hypothetical protein
MCSGKTAQTNVKTAQCTLDSQLSFKIKKKLRHQVASECRMLMMPHQQMLLPDRSSVYQPTETDMSRAFEIKVCILHFKGHHVQ